MKGSEGPSTAAFTRRQATGHFKGGSTFWRMIGGVGWRGGVSPRKASEADSGLVAGCKYESRKRETPINPLSRISHCPGAHPSFLPVGGNAMKRPLRKRGRGRPVEPRPFNLIRPWHLPRTHRVLVGGLGGSLGGIEGPNLSRKPFLSVGKTEQPKVIGWPVRSRSPAPRS
jgi:hypothetical protein